MHLNKWVRSIADAGRELLYRQNKGDRRSDNQSPGSSIIALCAALYSNKGEALGTALAGEVTACYEAMSETERRDFFHLLMSDYSPDPEQIDICTRRYMEKRDTDSFRLLNRAVEPPRQHLLRRMNMAPGGTRTIVNMRCDLLQFIKENNKLVLVDEDFNHLLSSWFNPGFLTLKRIDWATSARTLEKIISYEAVHAMQGWNDLKRRLDTEDRRCFGFFHPALPDEPLIFIEVALTNGVASSVQTILAPKKQVINCEQQDTAIFYSISNCQQGLKGISLGNFLIKRVVMELKQELSHLKYSSTLSPIPGFRRWLDNERLTKKSTLISVQENELLDSLGIAGWEHDLEVSEKIKPLLMRLCANYLYNVKKGVSPLDPVTRFHLGNGASIARINWLGDTSENGIKQSAGLLVNYRYDLDTVEENHEKFFNEGFISASDKFLSLLT
jgi:malonyl-CoA decarboxylase